MQKKKQRCAKEMKAFMQKLQNNVFRLKTSLFAKNQLAFATNNIQATISAFWLVKSTSVNPKSVQKSEIECKTVKLKWLTAPTLSSDKQHGRQRLNKDWNSLSTFQYNYLMTKQSPKLNNNN